MPDLHDRGPAGDRQVTAHPRVARGHGPRDDGCPGPLRPLRTRRHLPAAGRHHPWPRGRRPALDASRAPPRRRAGRHGDKPGAGGDRARRGAGGTRGDFVGRAAALRGSRPGAAADRPFRGSALGRANLARPARVRGGVFERLSDPDPLLGAPGGARTPTGVGSTADSPAPRPRAAADGRRKRARRTD